MNKIIQDIITSLRKNFITKNLGFFSDHTFMMTNTISTCIDNLYVGNFSSMKHLIYSFHFNLDDIINANKAWNKINQEHLVVLEGIKLNKLIPTIPFERFC